MAGDRTSAPGDAILVEGVRLTHPEKPLYAEQGLTKSALAAYFRTNPASKTIADVRANLVTDRMIQSPLFDALRQAGMPDA